MPSTEEILKRIDNVLSENRSLQTLFVLLITILFVCGIAAVVMAIIRNQFIWTIPSAFTSLFLKWPIQSIIKLREKNIALATIPILINTLPPEKVVEEIQKLIEHLYGTK